MNKARIVKHAQCVFLRTKTTVVNEIEIEKNRFKWIGWINAGITEAITEVNDWGPFVKSSLANQRNKQKPKFTIGSDQRLDYSNENNIYVVLFVFCIW